MAAEGITFEVVTTRAEVRGVPPESPDDIPFEAAVDALDLGLLP
ncbi:MAG: hypothetical protein JWN36_2924 [Microbacteriaceae bacterium]|nr:hypothetical protein [Microbacteriaceae bacterium]